MIRQSKDIIKSTYRNIYLASRPVEQFSIPKNYRKLRIDRKIIGPLIQTYINIEVYNL